MPSRETTPAGAPCWVDLLTSDADRTRAFYGEVFGWTAEEGTEEFGGYFNFVKDGVRVAGCMPNEPGSPIPDSWTVYLATDDAAKTCELAVAHGGKVESPAMAVGDLGTMAFLTDSGGVALGIWQPGLHPGFRVIAEPGTPSWFELHARDYQGAVAFYRDVFGWDTRVVADSGDFRYTTMRERDGDGDLAGIMDAAAMLPEGSPGRWSVYLGVDDTDAALAKIVEAGGSVLAPAEDTPYGRLAIAADPCGAQFKLVAPNDQMPAKG